MRTNPSTANAKSSYFHRWLSEWLNGFRSLRKDTIVIVLAVVTLFVQWKMGWIQIGHGWETIVVNLSLPLGVPLVFLILKLLRGYHREGELLKDELEKLDYPPLSLEQRTKTWRMYAANMLLQRRGETYEERFNKIGTKPELTELAKLHNQIYELKKAMDEAGALVASEAKQE